METDGLKKDPKEIIWFRQETSGTLFHLHLHLSSKNAAFVEVAKILDEFKVKILEGYNSALLENDSHKDCRIWSLFAESPDAEFSVERFRDSLQASGKVHESKIKLAHDGFLIDSFTFPLKITPNKMAMLLNRKSFSTVFGKMTEIFSTGASTILFEEGKQQGEKTGEWLRLMIGSDRASRNLSELLELYSSGGWGDVSMDARRVGYNSGKKSEVQRPSFVVRVKNSFECSELKGILPSSHYFRGHLCGYVSAILEKKMRCEELTCTSTGAEICTFRLSEV